MKTYLYLSMLVWLSSCVQQGPSGVWIYANSLEDEVSDTRAQGALNNFLNQRSCWNDGDVYCYVDNYVDQGDAKTITRAGITEGKTAILKQYLSAFPKDRMGALDFKQFQIYIVDDRNALVLGRYELSYPDIPLRAGYFSVLMINEGDQWKILTDHST